MSRRRRDRRKFFRALGPVAPRPVVAISVDAPKVLAVATAAAREVAEKVIVGAVQPRPLQPEAVELDDLTVAELRALAVRRGVVLGARRTKMAIIEALR